MERSESIKELAKALSAAQGVMTAAKMDKENPFLKNMYADLGSVISAAKQPMQANGLAVSQLIGGDGAHVTITTLLMHLSGEWLSTEMSMPVGEARGKSQAQEIGSIITYLRRYSLAAILGVHADEDVDGNGEGEKKQAKSAPSAPLPVKAPQESAPSTMTIEEAEEQFSTTANAPYGTLPTETLVNFHHGLSNAKKELTEDQRTKKAAIEIIMAARNAGRPVMAVKAIDEPMIPMI